MPKGQFPKLKGATVNVSVNVNKMFKRLPCADVLMLLKLKMSVYFEPVSRTKFLNAVI